MIPDDFPANFAGPLLDLTELEAQGCPVVEILAGDISPDETTKPIIDRLKDERHGRLHSDLLFFLTSERFPEPQAHQIWEEVLAHKFIISERLGRNVGVRVSAIDYLSNVRKLMAAPRTVKDSDFNKTIRLARTDGLTGLYNRRYFLDQLPRIMEIANQKKFPVCLLMTDLDHFKQFNDTNGHQAGDILLQEVARILKECVRSSDMVARYGGDEMCILLMEASKKDALPITEKIRRHIEREGKDIGITLSGGLAEYPMDAMNREDLLANADDVLYRAKEFGGNQICYFHNVSFRYKHPTTARNVTLVGSFNNWSKKANPMLQDSQSGEWYTTLSLKPGRYRYKFIIDNTAWTTDPNSTNYEDDGFGGQCSVLTVR